jgi:hypothetical protein
MHTVGMFWKVENAYMNWKLKHLIWSMLSGTYVRATTFRPRNSRGYLTCWQGLGITTSSLRYHVHQFAC